MRAARARQTARPAAPSNHAPDLGTRFAHDSPLEGDGFEPSVPRKAPDIDALKRRCSVPLAIGTQTGFAIGGFARVVAAAVQGEGPNAWVPVALLNLAICVVASIAAWTARDLTPIRR
jgi:hypothetical protein